MGGHGTAHTQRRDDSYPAELGLQFGHFVSQIGRVAGEGSLQANSPEPNPETAEALRSGSGALSVAAMLLEKRSYWSCCKAGPSPSRNSAPADGPSCWRSGCSAAWGAAPSRVPSASITASTRTGAPITSSSTAAAGIARRALFVPVLQRAVGRYCPQHIVIGLDDTRREALGQKGQNRLLEPRSLEPALPCQPDVGPALPAGLPADPPLPFRWREWPAGAAPAL
jgi:hypothetical protein